MMNVLNGRAVRIEPLVSKHADCLWTAIGQPDRHALWAFILAGPFDTKVAFDNFIAAKQSATDAQWFAIISRTTDRAEGMYSLMREDAANRVIEVGGIILGPILQKSVGATEAQYLLARYVFETLKYRRYEWKCDNNNAPSKRAAERFGFTFEGVFRQHMLVRGLNRDTAWFSMLDIDWPERKLAFEAWLYPANFDKEGRQRRKLTYFRKQ